jgi:ElaB/YqjD/DUF883 family membrane-anchored ribosome-binding protein
MNKDALATWTTAAQELPSSDERPKQPIYVMIGEAYDLASLAKKYWKSSYTRKNVILRRGLDLVGTSLPYSMVGELISLSDALQQAHSAYVLTTGPAHKTSLIEEAQKLVAELDTVLAFHASLGAHPAEREQLTNVETEHAEDPASPDAIASELDDYAALAEPIRKELDGLGGFDVSDIDHATTLATELRSLPPGLRSTEENQAEQEALELRNRVARLLQDRTTRLRQAGRFVFRDQREIALLFASTYERKKRAASRRRARQAPATPPAPATPTKG